MDEQQTNQAPTTMATRIANAQPLTQVSTEVKLQLAKRGIDEAGWNTLKLSLFAGASDRSVMMVLDYCKVRGLDPFKKPVHIVPMYNKGAGGMIDVVMPGINETRTTAMRTGEYVGSDGDEFGPEIELDLTGGKITVPEWCRYTIYRKVSGIERKFVGPKVYWEEAYATAGKDTTKPNAMWAKRKRGQLAKCAEAAALRSAFPEQLGNEPTAEEMEGQYNREMNDVKVVSQPSAMVNDINAKLAAEAGQPIPQTIDAVATPAAEPDDMAPFDDMAPIEADEDDISLPQ